MRRNLGGGLLALLLLATTAASGDLVVTREDGAEIARLAVPDGDGWCVLWHHSVQGFEVSDCYENRGGHMVLVRSHLPDFAAGLDHIPGRGRQVSDGQGGYWILDIDEPVPGDAYVLRPGRGAVDHRLRVGETTVSLSQAAPRARLRIELTGSED
ncbi:DUF1850 domain-containing protein [Tropicimonas sediminicola]|uniref:DUF1850 domain-containing protein n=1 Tax=Tropicimonas sediminicola TaxID=1031541 RepID=A0A239MFU2_9RHOB|nr:DUF1850 domain-containing protein [Tropicimonas sediminicola]SNT40838.1 protein of unknown function [Tropicimonas sediminicola]